jgi:hypothetical protein
MTMWPDAYVRGLQQENVRLRAEVKRYIIENMEAAAADPEILQLALELDPALKRRLQEALTKTRPRPLTQDEKIAARKRWDERVR